MPESGDAAAFVGNVSELDVTDVLATLPDALVVADAGTDEIVAANEAAGELFECHPQDLVGRDRMDCHPTGKRDAYDEAFQRGIASERVDRLEDGSPIYIETADGTRKPVEALA